VVFFSVITAIYGHDLYQQLTGHIEPDHWWRILIFGMPALLMVFCFINAERNGFFIHSSLINIGDASYSIYLSHILTLTAAGRIWSAFSSDSLYDNYLMVPMLFILTIIVGMFSYRYVEKPLLSYSRRIA
jgi:peptidoglycan/LPS O-acetylase OafA/YrhL